MDQDNYFMEWETLHPESMEKQPLQLEPRIIHSTPLSNRPAPTASPNLPKITNIEAEVSKLAECLAELKLN